MPTHHRLQPGPDGSVALYIGGDLQFDTRDEHVYHEALVVPALAAAAAARDGRLAALVIGGGDGLALRELLASDRVGTVELVDFDPDILALARTELAALNRHAFADPRVVTHVADARELVAAKRTALARYDVIICDLTWPQTPAEATFHTVAWYRELAALLSPTGVLAVNAASPGATPEAFWAMANGVREAGLHVRPYRIALPSFQARGYGEDWGLILAAPRPLAANDFGPALARPGRALVDLDHLRRMFCFPAGHEALARTIVPAGAGEAGGARIFEMLQRPGTRIAPGEAFDTLAADLAPGTGPSAADDALVPVPLREALGVAKTDAAARENLVERVLGLWPGLQHEPTRTLVGAFLEAPGRFLAAIDLPGLVDRLVARAAELPAAFAGELRLLQQALAEPGRLLEGMVQASARLLAVVTVVVILGNLAHPDAVFGKGASAGFTHTSGSFLHAGHGASSVYEPPSLALRGGFRTPLLGRGRAVDELGQILVVPRYRIMRYRTHHHYGTTVQGQGPSASDSFGEDLDVVYRLTPEVGLLADGRLVMDLDDRAFFMLANGPMPLYDRQSGQPLLSVASQPALTWRIVHELDRQRRGLEQSLDAKRRWMSWMGWLDFLPGVPEDHQEVAQLETMIGRFDKAMQQLPHQPGEMPPAATGPQPGCAELFNGAWILPDGNTLAIQGEDGRWLFLDPARGWFSDANRTQPATLAYPDALKQVLTHHLGQLVAESDASWSGLSHDLADASQLVNELQRDLSEYDAISRSDGLASTVDYGSESMSCQQALELTRTNLARAQQAYADLKQQVAAFPATEGLYKRLLAVFTTAGGKA